MSPLKKF